MTTLADVITKVDSIKPNVFSQSQKRDWIYSLEVQIREFKNLYTDEETDMLFLNDENATLCLDIQWTDIYVYYLMSMIDMANCDVVMYNNNTALFNEMLKSWQKKFRRENLPAKNTKITTEGR
jgi:hypothetical protein